MPPTLGSLIFLEISPETNSFVLDPNHLCSHAALGIAIVTANSFAMFERIFVERLVSSECEQMNDAREAECDGQH